MSWRRARAYAQDLRDRVLAATGPLNEVAARFGVSQAYVSRARTRRSQLGQDSAGAQCNHKPLRLAGVREHLLTQVAKAPEQTLAELCQWVRVEHGIKVAPTTMHKTLRCFGLTLKKDPPCQRTVIKPRGRAGPHCLGRPTRRSGRHTADLSR